MREAVPAADPNAYVAALEGWRCRCVETPRATGELERKTVKPGSKKSAKGIMPTGQVTPTSIDEYIASCPPEVHAILERIRSTIRSAAPDARETISYRIPSFTQNGALVYFAAFKHHIGFYPPVTGDARLEAAVSRYAGPKGNLKLPLHHPVPYKLIERIVKHRVRQNLAKAAAKVRSKP
jgi:uncharacterized protein YdhG (YjbR/CyaY superfamily)